VGYITQETVNFTKCGNIIVSQEHITDAILTKFSEFTGHCMML